MVNSALPQEEGSCHLLVMLSRALSQQWVSGGRMRNTDVLLLLGEKPSNWDLQVGGELIKIANMQKTPGDLTCINILPYSELFFIKK